MQADIDEYMATIRAEIQLMADNYLKEIGRTPGFINSIAKTIFAYLMLIANAPQKDNIKNLEIMHNFKGALMFTEKFFNSEIL